MTRTLRTHKSLLGEVTLEKLVDEEGKTLYRVKDSRSALCGCYDTLQEAERQFDLDRENIIAGGYLKVIRDNGFEITQIENGLTLAILTACRETDRGPLTLIWAETGCGKLGKPNGSQKWYYNKTAAQLNQILRTTIEANTEPARK